jgi:signal transduction histidine kinase
LPFFPTAIFNLFSTFIMKIFHKYVLYWVLLHALVAVGAVVYLEQSAMLILWVELGIVVSLCVALWLSWQMHRPLQLMQEGLLLLNNRELGTRLREDRQPEVAVLAQTYNRLLQHLQTEQQRMQEKDFLLEKIIRVSETGLLILDHQGKLASVNPSALKLLGHQQAPFEGLSLSDLPSPFGDTLQNLPLRESVVLMLPSRQRVRCLKNEFFDQGFPRIFITLDELTEELRKSELAAYEKLIRVISHEINNSLASFASLLQSLQDYAPQLRPDDQSDYALALQVMLSRTGHLNQFMQHYAEVVRLQKARKQPYNLVEVLQQTAALFRSDFARREITLEWAIAHTSCWVGIDRLQFEQALVNILKNGMEAIGRQGKLTIGLQKAGKQQVLLSITDTGGGIPEEVRRQLFTPFFSTKAQGQGIGLTFIQEVMHHHNFPFELESQPGGPTSFKIWLD